MDQLKFEKFVYEIARCWGINDSDLDIEYSLIEELGYVDILVTLIIPRNDDFDWMTFWGDVSNHISKEYDVSISVRHKREKERRVVKCERCS